VALGPLDPEQGSVYRERLKTSDERPCDVVARPWAPRRRQGIPMAGPNDNPRRRSFLNWLLGGSAAGLFASVVYPVARFVSPPDVPEAATNQIEAGSTSDPELVENGFKIVRFGSDPVIVVRVSDTEYRAFAATCTHLDCIVEYRQDKRLLWCWCHNGAYDLQGRNVAGPPPRPLEAYQVNLVEKTGQPATIVVTRA
jgi:cytochrome b6-f complex iron-sulfur subunit